MLIQTEKSRYLVKNMKKISLEKNLFSIIIWYPAVTLFFATFFNEINNKFYIVYMILLFTYYINNIALKKNKIFFFSNTMLCLYIIYSLVHSGIYYTTHLDFYCFVGFAYTMVTFSEPQIFDRFEHFACKKEKVSKFVCLTVLGLIVYSIINGTGVLTSFGVTSVPILYGPYTIPHNVAYICLIIYCMCAYYQRLNKSMLFIVMKYVSVLLLMWTGVRSAFLGIVILLFMDLFFLKKSKQKYLLFLFGIMGFIFLLLFTDFLTSNPIIQKTIVAAREGNITNSRDTIAAIILKSYLNETTMVEKFLGMGIDGVRNAMIRGLGVEAHGHNDYVNALCGFGIIGFAIYIFCQLKPTRIWKKSSVVFVSEMFLFVLIFTNGLAMYTVITPCLPVFILFAKECVRKKATTINSDLYKKDNEILRRV